MCRLIVFRVSGIVEEGFIEGRHGIAKEMEDIFCVASLTQYKFSYTCLRVYPIGHGKVVIRRKSHMISFLYTATSLGLYL